MKRPRRHLLVVPVLAAAIMATACSDQLSPSPDRLLGPDAPLLAKLEKPKAGQGKQAEQARERAKQKGSTVQAKKPDGEEAEFRLAIKKSNLTSEGGHVSAWVDGSSDVQLELAGHVLTIPEGIVDEPTLFSMQIAERYKRNDDVVEAVRLHAVRTEGRGRNAHLVDVGAQGFGAYNVELCVSYEDTDYTSEDLTDSWLVYLSPDGQNNEAIQASREDESGRRRCGDLNHFSDWALAWP